MPNYYSKTLVQLTLLFFLISGCKKPPIIDIPNPNQEQSIYPKYVSVEYLNHDV
jgi:hypothetical protein